MDNQTFSPVIHASCSVGTYVVMKQTSIICSINYFFVFLMFFNVPSS